MPIERRTYQRRVQRTNAFGTGIGLPRYYRVETTRKVPAKPPTDAEWEAFGRLMMVLAMPFIALWALFQWLIHANRKPASFDRQLWLSRSGESWVAMWEHVRRGRSRYDLYVYSPGDWVWNLVGSYTEWPTRRPPRTSGCATSSRAARTSCGWTARGAHREGRQDDRRTNRGRRGNDLRATVRHIKTQTIERHRARVARGRRDGGLGRGVLREEPHHRAEAPRRGRGSGPRRGSRSLRVSRDDERRPSASVRVNPSDGSCG
jgi:hypothetical protein